MRFLEFSRYILLGKFGIERVRVSRIGDARSREIKIRNDGCHLRRFCGECKRGTAIGFILEIPARSTYTAAEQKLHKL